MTDYGYSILAGLFFLLWLIVFLSIKKYRKKIIKASILGAILGPIAELRYYQDYRLPPHLINGIRLEDIIFGASILGIIMGISLLNNETKVTQHTNKKNIFILRLIGTIGMLLTTNILKRNSIYTSTTIFTILGLRSVTQTKKRKAALLTTTLITIISIIIYSIVFGIITPEFRTNYLIFNLNPTYRAFNQSFPLTEIWRYTSLTFMISTVNIYALKNN